MEHDSVPKRRPLFDLFFSYLDARLPSDRILIYVLLIVFVSSASFALLALNRAYSTSVPAHGGVLVEGIIGTPRFVNPVLALTRTDNDLVALIYSGLMKLNTDGELVPDLAESVTVSEDGLVYNVILRQDIAFHDGIQLDAEDVAYTIDLLQNPDLKSPLRGNWSGVSVEVLSDTELNFVLQDPYTPFLENLTVGIMPKHIWGSLSIEELPFSQHNTEPVGSGPYAIADTTQNDSGLISEYRLKAFDAGVSTPKISTIAVMFYPNEDDLLSAYKDGDITSTASLSYSSVQELQNDDTTVLIEESLPRLFALFFNQNKSAVLRDDSARNALNSVVNRNDLINEVLDGYGAPATSPVPPGFLEDGVPEAATSSVDVLNEARLTLVNGGWLQDEQGVWTKEIDGATVPLKVTITTANASTFEQTAYYLEHVWTELGVQVAIELYEQSDLVQTVIRPRNYEALLFGTEVGRTLDLYPFWHSSQREDPGLNVALYTNISTDALLVTARTTQDENERVESIHAFETQILEEVPAIFLYSPSFIYVTRKDVHPSPMRAIARPSERFSNVSEWYMNKENIWNIFVTEE